MKMKKLIGALLLLALLASCGGKAEEDRTETNLPDGTSQVTETGKPENQNPETENSETEKTEPQNNGELFDFVMDKWKSGETETLYPYLSDEMTALCDSDTIKRMFEGITDTFGAIAASDEPKITAVDGIDVYSSTVRLEHADADVTLSLKGTKIYGFSYDVRFNGEFDVTHAGIRQHYFLLNGLNAVYTCAENSERAPAVLMISGSGPSDYNGTIGMLVPMEDMAQKLAEQGISSLRLEKRTLRYASDFKATDGIEEEYFKDCRAALSYLKEQEGTDGVYLLGYSLGGQIAAALAAEDDSIAGMVLLMSTARHLADILCDQYTAAEPLGAEVFAQYRDAAKAQADGAATGQYYFGATDAYWASYNALDTIESIRIAAIPTAIINSTGDNQIFDADISLWSDSFSKDENVTLTVFDDMSHFGYKIDTRDTSLLYKAAEMPDELIEAIVQAIR
ncbi:MAG: alpha/beta fold hydrolase [Agathobacter sp.]|nr:alpha/beta fold hydrolase [Agathobacter sp.]